MKRLAILPAALFLLAIIAACGSDPTATPLPTSTPVPQINQVSFTAVDYGFSGPDSIPAGMTTMTLVNEGEEFHHQQLVRVPPGMTIAELLEAAGEEGPPPPGVLLAGGVSVLSPGISASATVNLVPGNYLMVCFIPNAEGVPHVALGMAKPLTVTEPTGPLAAEPATNLTLELVDFMFELSAPISAGPQTIGVINKGPQDHEAFLVKLDPGATADDILAAMSPGAPPGPPPGLAMGGFQAVNVGGGGAFSVEFTPGNYALICFVEDPASGVPHFALGMVEEFTVQ